MRDTWVHKKNKYGKEVHIPPQTGGAEAKRITDILDEICVKYQMEYSFDVKGERGSRFDIAVFGEGEEPKLFIEYDGADHYDKKYFLNCGTRQERAIANVAKIAIGDAKKMKLARSHDVPVLRIHPYHDDVLRVRICAWVEIFVLEADTSRSNEILLIDMDEKYGLGFPYTPRSEPSRAEIVRTIEHLKKYGSEEKRREYKKFIEEYKSGKWGDLACTI